MKKMEVHIEECKHMCYYKYKYTKQMFSKHVDIDMLGFDCSENIRSAVKLVEIKI